jgi:hypothetical protein
MRLFLQKGRLIAALTLAAMLCLGYVLIACMHIHIGIDGKAELHSHPYTDNDSQGQTRHSHSDSDKSFLAWLCKTLFLILVLTCTVLTNFIKPGAIHASFVSNFTGLIRFKRSLERAPPFPSLSQL